MDKEGICFSTSTFSRLVQKSINKQDLSAAREVYQLIVRDGFQSDTFLGSQLIRMFAVCGSLVEAKQVFRALSQPNVYSWSAIISAHAKLGKAEEAISLYFQMRESGVKPDGHVFVAVLKACARATALAQGKVIHTHIAEGHFDFDVFISNSLIDMYARCGHLDLAHEVFNKLPKPDVVTWNVMIAGYVQHCCGRNALELFMEMLHDDLEPDNITYVSIFKACASIRVLDQGKLIHSYAIEKGSFMDIFVGNTLIDMYAKCGSLIDAQRVFEGSSKKDAVTWNALMAGYNQCGHGKMTLQFFQQMQQQSMEPDNATFVCILKACSSIASLDYGRMIHAYIRTISLELGISIGNCLIDLYVKCGNMEDAYSVLEKMPKHDRVTWSTMIVGCVQHGQELEAFQLFQKRQQEGFELDKVTVMCILKACSSIRTPDQGKMIHAFIIETGFEMDICVGNTLVDMYAKCGSFQDLNKVFQGLPKRDVVTWNAMITAFAKQGNYKMALVYYEEMTREGLKPNSVTFICLLTALVHLGHSDKNFKYFKWMREDHAVVPTCEHYNCIVDLLGTAGHLTYAEDLLETMPFQSNVIGWTSLLGSCEFHGNLELGRQCFVHIVASDRKNSAAYKILSSICTYAGSQDDADNLEQLRHHTCVWKKPGKAFIEVNHEIHDFLVGDRTHSQIDSIYFKIKVLSQQSKDDGYIPLLDFVVRLD